MARPDISELPEFHPPCPETIEERVEYCKKLKRAREWTRGKTVRSLAKAWDLSIESIKCYSQRADKLLSIELGRPVTTKERVEYIAGLMERLEWRTGKTAEELAALWHLEKNTVEQYAAEASRRIVADPEEVHRDITVGGLQLLRDAVERGDAQAFRRVGELLANVSGISTKHMRHSIDHRQTVLVGVAGAADGEISIKEMIRQAFGSAPEVKALPDPETHTDVITVTSPEENTAGAGALSAPPEGGADTPLPVDQ